jgi:hypothetical protein
MRWLTVCALNSVRFTAEHDPTLVDEGLNRRITCELLFKLALPYWVWRANTLSGNLTLTLILRTSSGTAPHPHS